MLDATLLRGALSAASILFGSLGVYCDYMSFARPALAVHAVLFLGIAMAILHAVPQK